MPGAHVCGHCENQSDPVTTDNGFTFRFHVTKEDAVEVWLHESSAARWSEDFGIFAERAASWKVPSAPPGGLSVHANML